MRVPGVQVRTDGPLLMRLVPFSLALLAACFVLWVASRTRFVAPQRAERITGVALDHHGRPLGDVLLAFEPEGSKSTRRAADVSRRWSFVRGRGLVQTAADGSFELGDLPPGRYRIFVAATLWNATELTSEPIPAGAEGVRLRPTHPRVEVRVTGIDGRPQPLCGNLMDLIGSERCLARVVRAWPIGLDGERAPGRRGSGPCEVALGRAVFDLEPGTYRIECLDAARTGTIVTVAPGPSVTELDLMLPEPVALGDLAITVRDPEGNLYLHDCQIMVRRASDGRLAHGSRDHRGAWYRTALEPGDYLVRIAAEDNIPWCLTGFDPTPADFAPVEVPVTVRVGEEARVDVRLGLGGRLRVRLALPADPLRAQAWPDEPWAALEAGPEGPGVSLLAIPRGSDERIPLRFFVPGDIVIHHTPLALPGATTTTETLLPPGRYTLLLEDERWSAPPAEVSVSHGTVTEVVLDLSGG